LEHILFNRLCAGETFRKAGVKMPRGIQHGNREAKKPKKEKPKQAEAGYKFETAMLTASGSKGIAEIKKRPK
jgi:hypothetical protein